MATLEFANLDDRVITGTGQGPMNGALTFAMLFHRKGDNSQYSYLVFTKDSGSSRGFLFAVYGGAALLAYWNANTATTSRASSLAPTLDEWWLIAMTIGSATATPRFHGKNLTSGGAWVHQNADNAQSSNPQSASGGGVQLGRFEAGGSGARSNGYMGLVGWWDGTILTDMQIESLAANSRTSDWYALTPSSLTQLNTLTPSDLKGLVTWTNSGVPLTGTNPTGWTFDGVGGSPPTNSVAPAVTGTAVNGQTLTCGTGSWANAPTAYTYQWKRNGSAISGATASTYALVTADKGTSVKCTVTASNAAGSATADSNTVSVSSTLDALPDTGSVLIRTSTGWIELT